MLKQTNKNAAGQKGNTEEKLQTIYIDRYNVIALRFEWSMYSH